MKTLAPKPAFWVTNVSPMNVTLADLAINIKAYSTVNLLDNRRYGLSLDQLNKSRESGSIFKKRDRVQVREVAPPEKPKESLPCLRDGTIPSRQRSLFAITEIEYEELKVSDEEYAEENAELADLNEPIRIVTSTKG